MSDAAIRVLLVEDDPDHVFLVRETLASSGAGRFDVAHADSLGDALRQLSSSSFDVLLLDLYLPDSGGIGTVSRLQQVARDLPIIILTSVDDQTRSTRALHEGAQDYIPKLEMEGHLLARSIRYAIERKRAERELRERDERIRRAEQEAQLAAARSAELERDLRALERLSRPPHTAITARSFGSLPLQQSDPAAWQRLVERYQSLLDEALAELTYKGLPPVSERLRTLADELGFLRAGPRDVIHLHTTALKSKLDQVGPQRMPGFVDVGRLAALELMGYLVAYYRNFAVGVPLTQGEELTEHGGARERAKRR